MDKISIHFLKMGLTYILLPYNCNARLLTPWFINSRLSPLLGAYKEYNAYE